MHLVICPFCSIFILFCQICYHLYHLFTLSLFQLFPITCSMPPHSCRLCIVCTTSIYPSSTLYLLMPVLFHPITNILPLMPVPLLQFLFPSPLFLASFSRQFLASFSGRRHSPMKIKTGKTLRSQVTVVLPFLPIPQF